MANYYGLELIYRREFHEVHEDEQDDPEFGPLLQKMKVVDDNNESRIDEEQWEAISAF